MLSDTVSGKLSISHKEDKWRFPGKMKVSDFSRKNRRPAAHSSLQLVGPNHSLLLPVPTVTFF